MPYTLAQIYGAIGTLEHGQDMIKDLQEIFNQNNQQDKSNEILQKLGLKDISEVDKLVTTLDIFKKAGNDPNTLTAQLADLTNQVNDFKTKFEAAEAKSKEERQKRINNNITTELISALTKENVTMPELFAKVLANNVSAKDDESLVYKTADNKECSIADGVSAWVKENPLAVKNTIAGGAGSSGSSISGQNNMEQLENMSMADYIRFRTNQNKE